MKMKRFMIVLAALFALTVVSCGPDTWVAPDNLTAMYLKNDTQISISWAPVEGAGWYEIGFRRPTEHQSSAWPIANNVRNTAYVWDIPSGEEYNFDTIYIKVRAWKRIAASGSGEYYTAAHDDETPWSVEFPLATSYQD